MLTDTQWHRCVGSQNCEVAYAKAPCKNSFPIFVSPVFVQAPKNFRPLLQERFCSSDLTILGACTKIGLALQK